MRLLFSVVAALILGICAIFFVLLQYLFERGTDCAAYSPTRRGISFLLAPPIFLMQRWFFGTVDNVANFDPVIFGRFGWLVLWAYYWGIIAGAMHLLKRWRTGAK